jgi:small subunit ribosomal protein S16
VAVKIKLKRIGKIHAPQYRIVVADSRTARNGRAIEEIGIYQPMFDPSIIKVDSERAQYWLGVGAQPTEAVAAILKVTGDWQKFKGLPGSEGTLRVAEPKVSKLVTFEAAVIDAANEPKTPVKKPKPVVVEEPKAADEPTTAEVIAEAAEVGRNRGCQLMLEEALRHLVQGIVDHPEDVSVTEKNQRRGKCLDVRVNPEDMGRVIGRAGRTASALRTVVTALNNGRGVRIDFLDVAER